MADQQTRIRMPAALKEALETAAFEANRSFNAEVLARLEASLIQQPDPKPLSTMLASLLERVEVLEREVFSESTGNEALASALSETMGELRSRSKR